jgi:hypothetical protein
LLACIPRALRRPRESNLFGRRTSLPPFVVDSHKICALNSNIETGRYC